MEQIVVSISEDMKKDIEKVLRYKKITSEVLSQMMIRALKEKIDKIKRIEEIAAKSQATDKDVEEISNEIKDAVWKHYSKYFK